MKINRFEIIVPALCEDFKDRNKRFRDLDSFNDFDWRVCYLNILVKTRKFMEQILPVAKTGTFIVEDIKVRLQNESAVSFALFGWHCEENRVCDIGPQKCL